MLELESILLIIFVSLTMAIFIHGYYLLNQIHNKYVNENKSLGDRTIDKRKKNKIGTRVFVIKGNQYKYRVYSVNFLH